MDSNDPSQWDADISVKKEEDSPCCVCFIGDSFPDNNIVFCDGCDIAVHQWCYGVLTVPEGEWFCDLCLEKKSNPSFVQPKNCCLCPAPVSQLPCVKKTNWYRPNMHEPEWAHMQCAIWNPFVNFENPVELKPINARCLDVRAGFAPKDAKCAFCGISGNGLCVKCCSDKVPLNRGACNKWFHIPCAQRLGGHKSGFQIEMLYLPQFNLLSFPARCSDHVVNKTEATKELSSIAVSVGEEVSVLPAKNMYAEGKLGMVKEIQKVDGTTRVTIRVGNRNLKADISRLRKHAKPDQSVCLFCARDVSPSSAFLICETCLRPIHIECAGDNFASPVECCVCAALKSSASRRGASRSRSRVSRYGEDHAVSLAVELDMAELGEERKRRKSGGGRKPAKRARAQASGTSASSQGPSQPNAVGLEGMANVVRKVQSQVGTVVANQLARMKDGSFPPLPEGAHHSPIPKKVRIEASDKNVPKLKELIQRLVDEGVSVTVSTVELLQVVIEHATDSEVMVWVIRIASFVLVHASNEEISQVRQTFDKQMEKSKWTVGVAKDFAKSWLSQTPEAKPVTVAHAEKSQKAPHSTISLSVLLCKLSGDGNPTGRKIANYLVGLTVSVIVSSLRKFAVGQRGQHPNSYSGPEARTLDPTLLKQVQADEEALAKVNKQLATHEKFEPYIQGWCKVPFTVREYILLHKYQPAPGMSKGDKEDLLSKLQSTKLPECGENQRCSELVPYSIEKNGFLTDLPCLSRRVACSQRAVYKKEPLKLGHEVLVKSMWGIDCFARASILTLLEAAAGTTEIPEEMKQSFLGQLLLPLVNAQPGEDAHDIRNALVGLVRATQEEQKARVESTIEEEQKARVESTTEEEQKARVESTTEEEQKARVESTTEEEQKAEVESTTEEEQKTRDEFTIKVLRQFLRSSRSHIDAETIQRFAISMMDQVETRGPGYFKVHPKGVGVRCNRTEGIRSGTFVTEYLGELYSPCRWFEKQDAVKNAQRKLKFKPVLPDFYNIMLERHRDDAAGYDVLFVDPIVHGNFASRLCHSCDPNCATVVMVAGDRHVICVYAIRDIAFGEELTFDYSSVTEDENEFRAAICLCGSAKCRGSFLYYAGLGAFASVMNKQHAFLHRQSMLLRACTEPANAADSTLLDQFGFKSSVLRGLPPWVVKWTALALEYVEYECQALCVELLTPDPRPGAAKYSEESAMLEARGVSEARVQNIAITLNKIRYFLAGQGRGKKGKSGAEQTVGVSACERPLRLLSDGEVVEHLWTHPESIAKSVLSFANQSKASLTQVELAQLGQMESLLAELEVSTPQEARAGLARLRDLVRKFTSTRERKFNAVADVLTFWCHTHTLFTCSVSYVGVRSPIVDVRNVDIGRDGFVKSQAPIADEPLSREQFEQMAAAFSNSDSAGSSGSVKRSAGSKASNLPQSAPLRDNKGDEVVSSLQERDSTTTEAFNQNQCPNKSVEGVTQSSSSSTLLTTIRALESQDVVQTDFGVDFKRTKHEPMKVVYSEAKRYQAGFLWGQLSSWFKQTIADPSASLSAERRGTISLPDISSCFRTGKPYNEKERRLTVERLKSNPHASWSTSFHWSFKNKRRVYGSPWFDDFYAAALKDGAGGTVSIETSHAKLALDQILRK